MRSPTTPVAWLEEILRRADGCGTVRLMPAEIAALRAALDAARRPPLTVREQEVMHAAGRGLSNQEIAVALCITVDTVRCHLKSIYTKLGVRGRYALIRYVVERE